MEIVWLAAAAIVALILLLAYAAARCQRAEQESAALRHWAGIERAAAPPREPPLKGLPPSLKPRGLAAARKELQAVVGRAPGLPALALVELARAAGAAQGLRIDVGEAAWAAEWLPERPADSLRAVCRQADQLRRGFSELLNADTTALAALGALTGPDRLAGAAHAGWLLGGGPPELAARACAGAAFFARARAKACGPEFAAAFGKSSARTDVRRDLAAARLNFERAGLFNRFWDEAFDEVAAAAA